MSDVFTPEKRSEVMSRIRSRDTKPERIVGSTLHRLGHQAFVVPPSGGRSTGKAKAKRLKPELRT